MKDERVELAIKETRSEIAIIIYTIVIISYLIKKLILNMNQEECTTEYIIMILFPIYQFIRMQTLKVSLFRKSVIAASSLVLILITMGIGLVGLTYSLFIDSEASIYIFIYIVLATVLFFSINIYGEHRAKKLEKEFDDKD